MADAADPEATAYSVAEQVFGDQFDQARRYRDLLATDGIERGLIGPREVDRLWSRHLLNSAAVADALPKDAEVIDVGSGAGLPGIPVALARPDLGVTLLEPLLRRYNFLTMAVEELGLTDRVAVERGRAEDFEGSFDAVVSRAVAPLDRLVDWCLPLLSPTGTLIALKGASAVKEAEAAQQVLEQQGLTVAVVPLRAHPATESTLSIWVRRMPGSRQRRRKSTNSTPSLSRRRAS